jgi:hypothetical protein
MDIRETIRNAKERAAAVRTSLTREAYISENVNWHTEQAKKERERNNKSWARFHEGEVKWFKSKIKEPSSPPSPKESQGKKGRKPPAQPPRGFQGTNPYNLY